MNAIAEILPPQGQKAHLQTGREKRKQNSALQDLRFSALVGREAWQALRPAIRKRFSRHVGATDSVVYHGMIIETRMSKAGWCFSQLARLIGAPLPLERGNVGQTAVVTVTEARGGIGQLWTRLYTRRKGFPQVIHSMKSFAGPSGLREQVGGGVGMNLKMEARGQELRFISSQYFWKLGRLEIPLPRLAAPGELRVIHRDLGEGSFAFILSLNHPVLGELLYQRADFEDGGDDSDY